MHSALEITAGTMFSHLGLSVPRFRVSIFRCLNSDVLFALEQQPSKL